MSKFWLPFDRETKRIFLRLSHTASDVLDYLLDEITYNGKKSATMSYAEIAKAIGKKRSNVFKAVKELEQKKRIYIRRDGQKRIRITVQIKLGNMKKSVMQLDNTSVMQLDNTCVMQSHNSSGMQSHNTTLLESKLLEDNKQLQNELPKKIPKPKTKQPNLFDGQQEFSPSIKKDKQGFELPAWIDLDTWHDFLEMRKKIKKPPTVRAKELVVMDLEKFCNGDKPKHKAILEQSIKNSWQGIFDISTTGNRKTFQDIEQEKRDHAINNFHRTMSKTHGVV